ncbi:PRA1 family protein A1 [Linum perenne]
MDWGTVTSQDLIDALREVDWSSPPRPFSEFFSRFTVPKSSAAWNSRLKCNFYYYRTNYFLMIVLILGIGFLRRPLSVVAVLSAALCLALLNDSFAGIFSEKVTRTVRQFSPHLAAKMRPPLTPVIRGRRSAKRPIYICGRPRWMFVAAFSFGISIPLTSFSFDVALSGTVTHASFRTPNLKARLNTFREEFRAVWRNYNDL